VEGMKRGELAKRTGVSMATIRYYEDNDILPPPKRGANGYRVYTEDYLVKIQFIKDAQSLGYSLKEAQEAMQLLSQEKDMDTIKQLVQNKIIDIDEKIKSLHNMQALLSSLLQTSNEEFTVYLKSFQSPDA
jgi:MerR family copper efflux transcriptional regulator